ncbi:xanthine dehydrogenase molybdenum-binding subunit XdhA [Enterococcus hirae]|nr:xanthine dehydrogenase molybdenum-binding subunit XdhA [Enterococcus hirae]
MGVGKSLKRVDAVDKVTGVAKYSEDMVPEDCLVAKVVHSTIANGRVKSIDTTEAEKVPGVVKIFTCFDVPDIQFPTPGHPWSVEPAHQDIQDRKMLNERVRCFGDDIAAIVAEDNVACQRAERLLKIDYEEYEPVLKPQQSVNNTDNIIHEERPNNIIVHANMNTEETTFEEAIKDEEDVVVVEREIKTPTIQHCHIESALSWARVENGKIVVVSSTQIPHICRRVVAQALGIDWGKVRVIKPYIGGGFGNKQEVLYEPINAWLCTKVGGRAVKLVLSREEVFECTRVRHAMDFTLKGAVRKDGTLVARQMLGYSNQGGYASHGHALLANAMNIFKQLYHDEKTTRTEGYTVYTNLTTAGAMRAYGIPQGDFATECLTEDMALAVGMDPLEFRLKNCIKEGYVDPHNGITMYSYGLTDCIERGRKFIHWDEKRKEYQNQTGPVRKGIGMAIFNYKSNVFPFSLETSSCRMVMNQDGSMQLQMGATEIGQGADTVFTQMAAEATGITEDNIYIVSTQDTDVAPFDTGAYGSRQTYVCGMAIKKTGGILKEKLLGYASYVLKVEPDTLDIVDNQFVEKATGKVIRSVAEVAMESFYSLEHCEHITAEATHQCKQNTFSTGVCFVDIEVDMPLGKVKINNIINVHDSGKIINPATAEGQVHGGMAQGLGYGLSEEILYDDKGRMLNGNLLDYKVPTSMDVPELHGEFVEVKDPTGPFGNKALGEPPCIPVAPAIRNAILNATGIGMNEAPMTPQRLVEAFKENGLI